MARKKPQEKKDMEAVASETEFVRLELPIEIHRASEWRRLGKRSYGADRSIRSRAYLASNKRRPKGGE